MYNKVMYNKVMYNKVMYNKVMYNKVILWCFYFFGNIYVLFPLLSGNF